MSKIKVTGAGAYGGVSRTACCSAKCWMAVRFLCRFSFRLGYCVVVTMLLLLRDSGRMTCYTTAFVCAGNWHQIREQTKTSWKSTRRRANTSSKDKATRDGSDDCDQDNCLYKLGLIIFIDSGNLYTNLSATLSVIAGSYLLTNKQTDPIA